MKSRSHIAQCKAEIAETAGTVVLNTDIPELRKLADLISDDKRLIECSTSSGDNMSGVAVLSNVQGVEVLIDGKVIYSGPVPGGVNPGNVACAIGAAVALGVSPQAIARQLPSLPAVDHRAVAARDARGVWIIDDTYNSNPSGASSALRTALNLRSPSSQVWVVTPGMFELGRNQRKRNRLFAEEVGSSPGTTLCIVGRTNRKALEDGARGVDGSFRVFRDRSAAIRALDESARPGDVILFENDLPDYYP